jgi:Domain of unknown function (DUF5134)
MGLWWSAHPALQWATGAGLVVTVIYCAIRLILRPGPVTFGANYASSRASDACHVAMNGAMALLLLPIGEQVPSRAWLVLFGLMAAGFAAFLIQSLTVRSQTGAHPANDIIASYHLFCALAMLYMLAAAGGATGNTMVMGGSSSASQALVLPAIGWVCCALLTVDAVAVFSVVTVGGGLAAARVPTTAGVIAASGAGEPADPGGLRGNVLASDRLGSLPHLAMDLSMAAMFLVMLMAH